MTVQDLSPTAAPAPRTAVFLFHSMFIVDKSKGNWGFEMYGRYYPRPNSISKFLNSTISEESYIVYKSSTVVTLLNRNLRHDESLYSILAHFN